MRQLVRPLTLLVALLGCAPDTRTPEERLEDDARADSSAAGYEVGVRVRADTADARGSNAASTRDDSAPVRRPDGGAPPSTAGSGSTASHGDTAPRVSTAGGNGSASAGGDPARHSSATRTPRPDTSRRDAGSTPVRPLDPALEANFLVYDTTRKTATFQLAAGDEIPDQVSFNGARRGGRTLTVPLGWRVTIAFANRDPALPHSATIVDVAGPVPEQLPEPVFLRGQTVKVDEGLLEGDADEIIFLADRVGRYLIACGVIGHAQRGQWITLDVSTTAPVPSYR